MLEYSQVSSKCKVIPEYFKRGRGAAQPSARSVYAIHEHARQAATMYPFERRWVYALIMWQKLVSPKHFYFYSLRFLPWIAAIALICLACGAMGGLIFAPADYQQGDAFRIIYVHVPASILSLFIYTFMAVCALAAIIWRIKLAEVLLKASAPIGLMMTLLALITGSIWGKPMWGTWWIWDARLTSELLLFFLYFAIIAIMNAIRDPSTAARAAAIIVLVGLADIPIIHYSVNWWNTLHQGATITRFAKPAIADSMLYPLLLMITGFFFYFAGLLTYRAQTEILLRERNAQWIAALLEEPSPA